MQTLTSSREGAILRRVMDKHFYNAMVANNGFVAGGAIRSVFASESINDFDIFFGSQKDFDGFIATLNASHLKEYGETPVFSTTDTAWTHMGEKMRYQVICAEFGTPAEIIQKFDFTMCMAVWCVQGDWQQFLIDDNFLKHTSQRRLVFNANGKFPICSLWRAFKFVKRGWKLPAIEAIKISLCINNLALKDRKELKRQLLGIDTLFLRELTDALAKDGDVAYDFGEAIDFIVSFVEEEEFEE